MCFSQYSPSGTRTRYLYRFKIYFQVGHTFFQTLCKDKQSHWIGLQKNFESKKRQFSPSCKDFSYLELPSCIENYFVEKKKSSLSKILDTKGYNDVVHEQEYLGLSAERMKKFFDKAIDKIIDHLQALLHESNLRGVGTILLVGGFSESPMVSDRVRSEFDKMSVIAPPTASIAILKGAVMYGVDRNIIASRVSPYSYGVHTRAVYNSKIHPATSKTTISKVTGKKVVINAFDKFIEVRQIIQVGGSSKIAVYHVITTTNKEVFWNVYKSPKKEPGTCDKCTKVGRLRIEVPSANISENVKLEVKMTCRGTELEAEAKTVDGGVECRAFLDFLGMEDQLSGDEDRTPEKIG